MGEPRKCPGSPGALAAWKRCCRSPTERRGVCSHAPQPLRWARGSRGRGHIFSAPSLVALCPGSSRWHHRWGKVGPLEVGTVTSSRKHPLSFPHGPANRSGRQRQMWLHLKAVNFNRAGLDSWKPLWRIITGCTEVAESKAFFFFF